MVYHSYENKKDYFPPLLSNGEISFAPDAEGVLAYSMEEYQRKGVQVFDGIVVRSGRRLALCDSNDQQAKLFPMGKFAFSSSSKLVKWSQSLKVEEGSFESECLYKNGDFIRSKGFIHPDHNIYALQKSFSIKNGSRRFSYDLTLCGYDNKIGKYMDILYAEKRDGICCIGFKMYGMDVFRGEIRAFIDKEYTIEQIENGIKLLFDISDGENITFYYYLEDDFNGVEFTEQLRLYEEKIAACGFGGLFKECTAHYKAFWDLGYVRTSDDTLNKIYQTSLYAIKCNTTKYSIAVGLNNCYWHGRFFAFDEFTSFLALLGANRLELAKRVPTYRLKKCLPTAIERASDCHRNSKTEDMARILWESGESGKMELAPLGNWIDHIFHIPLVGIGAFNFYEYSDDRAFLEECYPLIRACSKFITKHMVYRDGEKFYIGKCTDLERLGSSIQNPFLTACGAIKLLECCHKVAKILKIDIEYAEECAHTAKKLLENLPTENGRYVPHLECDQKSIAVFGGKFPFDVLESNDEKMLKAWDDFEENGASYGNMYPMGSGISPWYACWKAEGYARAGIRDRAYATLKQAYPSAGVFNELFEINEEGCRIKPWFSTAAGIFVSSVNEMLLQCDGSIVKIMPGMPHNVDASFKLAAKGGITVEAEIKSKKLVSIVILKNGINVTDQYHIEF